MDDFRKFATKHLGMNSMVLDDVIKSQGYLNPYILEERQLNVTQLDVFSRLMMDRIIFLGEQIDEHVAGLVVAQLLFLEAEDPDKDICIYINSPGGSVTAGMAIYDTMRYLKCEVSTLCIGMAAPAFAYGDDTAPVEQPVLPEVVEEDVVTVTDETSGALTPEGNLTLVDDYHTNYSDGSGQQFITLVSKSGATFYLVIDRNAKGQQTVHFMNLVDEADLLALMEADAADAYTAEKEAAAQAEQDKLKAEEEAKKAAEEAAASDAEQPKENKVTKYAAAFLGVVALIALVAGGGFYFFIQQKHKKQAEKEAADPDADYTEDNGNFEIPPEDDSDDEDTSEEQDVTPI